MRAAVIALLLLVKSAQAEEPGARIPAELRDCIAIQRNTERLACFDRGIDVLLSRVPAAAAPGAESSFGMHAKAPPAVAVPDAERAAFDTLEAHVRAIETAADGSAVLILDNEQSWRQISGSATLLLAPGDAVTIRRAALGSFLLSTPTGRSAKVKRVR
jgi:hypothetical protein